MGQMYGKKRIVLTKDGIIVLAGGKNWHPIGKWTKSGLSYTVTVLRPESKWERNLTVETAERLICQSKGEARERIADLYA
jgi:hypothetical protein